MDEVLSALGCVPVRECSYAEWLETGMALKDAGYACEVWDEWSRDDPRYVPGDCERRWAGFRGAPRPVTVRSILALARRHGWFSAAADFADDTDATPAGMLARYIETLYQPEETVGFATQVKADSHGRYKPVNTNLSLKAADFIERLEQCGSIEEVIGPYRPECGAWIRMNPLDGKGQADKNVVAFRYVLIESDTLPREEQERFYRKYELPIACLVDSAGKSVHAVVHIDAPGEQEYRKRVNYLFRFLEARGFPVDNANKNPSRLSRMPGAVRGGAMQTLLATNIGRRSWGEWLEYAEELALLPEPVTLSDVKEPPEKPPELIAGVLRRGHKALIAGPSKAAKSFLLIELAISIAEGRPWLGFPCRQGKVLYMNLEIDPASCIGRFLAIYRAMGIEDRHDENIVIWNLRGHALPLDRLAPLLIRRMKGEAFSAVIIDPIYKVITGDENNASDMGAFCNLFDKICTEMGASAIYCHHHSKGTQGWKKAMDRASGSGGVLARPGRDPRHHRTEAAIGPADGGGRGRRRDGDHRGGLRFPTHGVAHGGVAAGIPAHPPHQLFLRLPAAHAGHEGRAERVHGRRQPAVQPGAEFEAHDAGDPPPTARRRFQGRAEGRAGDGAETGGACRGVLRHDAALPEGIPGRLCRDQRRGAGASAARRDHAQKSVMNVRA